MKIGILDYGVGNLFSLKTALEKLDSEPLITSNLNDGDEYDGIILPGVGNFSTVTRSLGGNREFLIRWIDDDRPLLGVCLGMQLLFEESDEGPGDGLRIFSGRVRKLPNEVKIPHMGWNVITRRRDDRLLDGLEDKGSWVYFVHSFYPDPEDDGIITTETEYAVRFPSIISSNTKPVYGTQFHPEKSGVTGERILRNFIEICAGRGS